MTGSFPRFAGHTETYKEDLTSKEKAPLTKPRSMR